MICINDIPIHWIYFKHFVVYSLTIIVYDSLYDMVLK